MRKIVIYEVDLNNPPPLRKEQQIEIKALSEIPDSDIGFYQTDLLIFF